MSEEARTLKGRDGRVERGLLAFGGHVRRSGVGILLSSKRGVKRGKWGFGPMKKRLGRKCGVDNF